MDVPESFAADRGLFATISDIKVRYGDRCSDESQTFTTGLIHRIS
jgi:hypothetical protein